MVAKLGYPASFALVIPYGGGVEIVVPGTRGVDIGVAGLGGAVDTDGHQEEMVRD